MNAAAARDAQARRMVRRGYLNLSTIIVLALVMVFEAGARRADTGRLAECNRATIVTQLARDHYATELRALNNAEGENTTRMVTTVATARTRATYAKALADYRAEAARITERREKVRAAQARHKFPSLAQCE